MAILYIGGATESSQTLSAGGNRIRTLGPPVGDAIFRDPPETRRRQTAR